MKTLFKISLLIVAMTLMGVQSFAQDEGNSQVKKFKIIKQNGVGFVGQIVSKDAREVLIDTEDRGLVYIPTHEIEEIIEIQEGSREITGGLFSSRYFLTTNGFNISKGDNYVQWNIFGPDFQFGVADNFTMGVMTSWVGMPIIGTAKYSLQLGDKLFGGLGFLGGTGSWAYPKYGLVLPFGFLSAGDRVNNLNFSTGYGFIFTETGHRYVLSNQSTDYSTNSFTMEDFVETDGRMLFSIAGMFRINDKFSFVFDSFIMPKGKDRMVDYLDERYNESTGKVTFFITQRAEESNALLVLVPGLRFQATEKSSFQFGFTGIRTDGEFLPLPIPLVQWFRRI